MNTEKAQAGAVACTIRLAADDWNPYELLDIARLYVEGASGLEAGDELFIERIRECLHQQKRTQDSAPPAAVSVEALKGLVTEWRKQAALLRDKTLPFPERMERRFMTACDADRAADELTQLIKERSNG